jgi:rhodanese-related sulfurtransferase
MERTIKPEALKNLIAGNSVTLLDVRRPNDFAGDTVMLPGAEWKNPEQLAQWSQSVPKDREVVVYCVRGGAVSNSVVDTLHAQGVKARFIEGGIEAWKAVGGVTAPKQP